MTASIDRVIVVTDNAHVNGGSGKVALSSAVALHRYGIPTSIFAAVGPVAPSLTAERGLEVLCTGQPDILSDPDRLAAASRGIWNVAAGRAMKTRLAAADPRRTVVHVHSWTKALSSSVIAAAVEGGFPVVATLHDYFTACPIGSFFDHQRGEICAVRPMGAACLTRNCDPRSGFHKAWRIGRHAVQRTAGKVPNGIGHFVAISELSESVLRPYLPPNSILHFVANPIDVALRQPVRPSASREFTFVGRLSQEKGVVLLARAAQRLGIQAVFVGDGECAAEVRAACPSAVITGWLDHERAIERMRAARVIVLPSLWYENAPLVVPEAAAMGLPSIVPDTSAAREAIIDGATGLTFRGGSEDDLVAKLAALQDDDLVARLGEAAYSTYWQRPQSMENHLEGLLDVYNRALTGVRVPLRQPPLSSRTVRFEHAEALQ
jgi:glycosyltransferase involved in cell wall biosynthesis